MIEKNIQVCRILYTLFPHILPCLQREYPGPVMDICPVYTAINIVTGSAAENPL
jgi:hypothetical protein